MVSQIELLCAACGKTFTRSVKSHNQRVSRGAKQFFCSTACVLDKKRREEHQCEFCGTATFNPKFCSQSCSASRRLGIQRNPPKLRVCLACGGEFLMSGTHRSPKYCPPCKGSNTWPTVDLKRPHIRRGSRYFTRPDYKNVGIIPLTPVAKIVHKSLTFPLTHYMVVLLLKHQRQPASWRET